MQTTRLLMAGALLGAWNAGALATPASGADAGPVAASAEEVEPVDVGQRAPAVTFRNLSGRDVALASLWGEKPVVLIFYRGGW